MSNSLEASVDSNPLWLAPEPSAVRDARAWVGSALAGWPTERVSAAKLLISELVTNSVLHARTPIAVAYRREGNGARFEVTDGLPTVPVAKRYAPDSPTGRGIRLVSLLADGWGVEQGAEGKTVWFTVSPSTRAVAVGGRKWAAPDGRRSGTRPVKEGHASGRGSAGGGAVDEDDVVDVVDVVALGLPVEVYLEAEQHNDAVVRELTLIVQSARTTGGLEEPRRLILLASEVRAVFSLVTTGLRAQVEDAALHGRDTVDIHMSVPRHGWETVLRLADWLDDVDRYCVRGDLLTLSSSPRLRKFREWYVRQVVDQMHGGLPTPWEATASD